MKPKNEKKISAGKIIGLLLALYALESDLLYEILAVVLILLPFILAGYLIYRAVKNRKQLPTSYREALKIPKNCTHKDKSIHHVRRGKEIDPWDRPDIDISKYQRKL